MPIKVGDTTIDKLFVGTTEITKVLVISGGSTYTVYESSGGIIDPPDPGPTTGDWSDYIYAYNEYRSNMNGDSDIAQSHIDSMKSYISSNEIVVANCYYMGCLSSLLDSDLGLGGDIESLFYVTSDGFLSIDSSQGSKWSELLQSRSIPIIANKNAYDHIYK